MIGLMWRRIRRRNYVIADNAVLYGTARIVNNRSRDAIEIGEHTHVKGELLTFGHGGRIRLGEYCFVGENSYIWSAKGIYIGDRVLIAHNCNIFDNDTHPINPEARHHQFREIITAGQPCEIDLHEKEVIIENDAWIAAGSSILKGVRIGRAAIVGIGSVVTRDVPPYTIVAGNPARVIREIPPEER